MKKNTLKKGFTIVELVIVIAVIAILSAVLIPTFSSVVHNANVSSDKTLVRNLNTALAASVEKEETMQDALKAADDFGYDVAKINATKVEENDIVWDSEKNEFVYNENGALKGNNYWVISNTVNPDCSTYLWKSTLTTVDTAHGIDVSDATNAVVETINYTSSAAQSVIIATASEATVVTVNAPNSNVRHDGIAGKVVVEAVKGQSYHEFGQVYSIQVAQGHVVVEPQAVVNAVIATATTATVKVEAAAVVQKVYATVENVTVEGAEKEEINESEIEEKLEEAQNAPLGNGTEASPFVITNADQFNAIAAKALEVNEDGAVAYFELGADIDLTNVEIVNSTDNISMNFDGKDHTISGVSKFAAESNNRGLFPFLENSTVKNVTVDFAITNGSYQGGMSYRTKGDCTFENVTTTGSIQASAWATAFVAYPDGHGKTEGSLTFINCVNNASLRTDTDQGDRYGAGFIAHAGDAKAITFNNCTNNGNIIASRASGFVGMGGANAVFTFVGTNVNNGMLSYTDKAGHFHYGTTSNNENVNANGMLTLLSTFETAAPTDKLVIDLQEGAASYKVTVSIATQLYNYPGHENVWGGGFPVHLSKTYEADYVADGTLTTDFGKFVIAEAENDKKNYQDDSAVEYNGIFFDINQEGVEYIVGDADSLLSLVKFGDKTFFYLNNNEYRALLTSDMLADESKQIGIIIGIEAYNENGGLISSSSTVCYVTVAECRAAFEA